MTPETKRVAARWPQWGARVHWLWLPASVLLTLAGIFTWQHRHEYFAADSDVGAKGDAELLVYAKTDQHIQLLDRFNREVHIGDELRFVLTGIPEGSAYLMVASVDSQGKTAIYYPYQGQHSAALPGPGRWEVPGSIVLDETPGAERIFALFSKSPLPADRVHEALAALGRRGQNAIRDTDQIAISPATQRSFLLFKQPRSPQ